MIEIGLIGQHSRNIQNPPIVVTEARAVKEVQYTLVGAVQMGPCGNHFLAIVRQQNGVFGVVDDLKDDIQFFPTFAAAVSRNNDQKTYKVLDRDDQGLFLLFYMKLGTSS